MNLTPYLEDLERRIDPAVEDPLLDAWQRFTDGTWGGELFVPRRSRPAPPGLTWPDVSVNQAIRDYDAMVLHQLKGCSQILADGTGGLLCVRSNYGTSILPSLFGAELFWMDEATQTLPTSLPVPGGEVGIRALLARGVPELRQALGQQTLTMGERFRELLGRYPKISRYVHLYHPDLQGPLDVCEVLWGSSLFLAVVDCPELVRDFLNLITETYTRFMQAWLAIVPLPDAYDFHWSMRHKGHIMLRDDSAMNISPELYRDLVRPCDQRLLAAFGGGALHFCGRGDHYIGLASEMPGLYAVAMSQPECNDMEVIYRHTVDRGIALIGFSRPAAEQALRAGRALHGRVHCW